MVEIPAPQQQTRDKIYAWEEQNQEDSRREHLGGSLIGRECERQLWYGFRWALNKKHDGRLLRLFRRGHEEEDRFVKALRGIGCEVHEVDDSGNQYRMRDLGGHFSGSIDGAVLGLPEAPKTWHLTEFKTHNDKSFKALEKAGVQESKPEHYAQMQVYMHYTGLTRALYMAVNKNDDAIYTERIKYDVAHATTLIEKARRVITRGTPPERIGGPDWYKCKWCDFNSICHQGAAPDKNCRTCRHSKPNIEQGGWTCLQDCEMGDGRSELPCYEPREM